jgi:hypothetical protein
VKRAATLALAGFAAASVAASEPAALSMNAQQLYLFQHAYPNAQVIFDCQGNFTGASDQEHVLGIQRPGAQPERIGLVLDSGKWLFHDIEAELKADKLPPRRWPQRWEAPPAGLAPLCNIDPHRARDLNYHGTLLGGKPFFRLPAGHATACFATSEQYNNWDCVAYGTGHFRLWYQQVFAD